MISLASLKCSVQLSPALGADITRHINIAKIQQCVVVLLADLPAQKVICIERPQRFQKFFTQLVSSHKPILRPPRMKCPYPDCAAWHESPVTSCRLCKRDPREYKHE